MVIIDWQATPSAARLAYERDYTDLANFIDLMPFVDALDNGYITGICGRWRIDVFQPNFVTDRARIYA